MKKFMKGCIITALILLVLGFALAIVAGTAEGASKVNEVVESVTNGKVHLNFGDGWGVFIGENLWSESEALFNIDDNTIFDDSHEVFTGNVDKYAVGSNVAKLDIAVGGCTFEFQQSDDKEFYVEATNAGKFQCFLQNDTLYVKSSQTVVEDWDQFDDGEIILYIPANYSFEQVNVELGAGLMEIPDIATAEMNLEVGAGQITVDYLQTEKCDIEVGMGEIIVKDMQVTKLSGEAGMGHLQMAGTVLGDVDAECSMGSIELDLTGSEEDFDYTLEAAMGNVSIGGEEYSGLTQEKSIQNNAGKQMNIECAMGNIEVDFED